MPLTRRQHLRGLAASLAPAAMATSARAANRNVAYGAATLPDGIRSRFVNNINGLRMHILEAGFEARDRPCVLLLHGFPELAYSWRKQMLPLASAGYHVIAPDLRGYGRTTGWDGNYDGDLSAFSLLNTVRDALSLVSALGYRSVAGVIGHDAGSPLAAWCALSRPDVFRSVALMSAPFAGPPALPFNSAGSPADTAAAAPSIHDQLRALPRLRKYYQNYYTTREANANMLQCPQGIHAFLRAYYHYKSADWKHNKPFPLKALTADEWAKLPTYYVMDLNKGMAETVAPEMPSAGEIAACKWLTEEDLKVYSSEYGRTGFQGGLQGYRVRQANSKYSAELRLFSGRTIDAPSLFIGGKSDWGVYQSPGAAETMQSRACTRMLGFHLVDGAGHWVQQEQPEEVNTLLLRFLNESGATG